MRCRITARKSHLARLQALSVGGALAQLSPGLELEYQFRESLGDINAHDPLWKMPEKGVFTQDFHDDLISGRCDLVVHSWKDLPLEKTPGTRIAATLPREDARDLLLVRKDLWRRRSGSTVVEILTSSPRRTYNLGEFLSVALPPPHAGLSFTPVRGNIPTRVAKLLDGNSHGLVLAKAALDRLLTAPQAEFAEVKAQLRSALNQCLFMVLPLSANPTAAAQGALAIEVADTVRPEILSLLQRLNCRDTFECVEGERAILGGHGGGCHQKIGVSILKRDYGELCFVRGLTDQGEELRTRKLTKNGTPAPTPVDRTKIFPENPKADLFFDREALKVPKPSAQAFWVARADAWPVTWPTSENEIIWTAGLESWKKLASRGLWVNGSSEGLGESEMPGIANLASIENWTKLTHAAGIPTPNSIFYPTYRLVPRAKTPSLEGKTHFYWMSGSAFKRALSLHPEIRRASHASGPGHTSDVIRRELGSEGKSTVELSYEAWLKNLLAKDSQTV